MTDPLQAAMGKAYAVSKELGLHEKILAKLLGNKELAAQQLALALVEVRKTFSALRDTLQEITYLGLPGQDQVEVMRALDRIEGGDLYERVITAKGHCHRIGNIYDKYLDAWFPKIVKPKKAASLRQLFNELRNSDGWAVDACERLLVQAKPLATEVRGLLHAGEGDKARKRIVAFSAPLQEQLLALTKMVTYLLDQESRFIEEHGIT